MYTFLVGILKTKMGFVKIMFTKIILLIIMLYITHI